MTNQEIKNLPIQFQKVEAGVYVSTDGRWKIHRTEHTGRMSGQARVRWHITDTTTGRPVGTSNWRRFELTLADAIEHLHCMIGRGVKEAFNVLCEMRRQAERQEAAEQARRERIGARATKIATFVAEHGAISDADGAARLAAFLEAAS